MNVDSVMSAIVAKEHIANASTVFECVDTLSDVFSIEVANSNFVNRASNSIQRLLSNTFKAIVQEAIADIEVFLFNKLSLSLRIAILQAVLNVIKDV